METLHRWADVFRSDKSKLQFNLLHKLVASGTLADDQLHFEALRYKVIKGLLILYSILVRRRKMSVLSCRLIYR